MSAFYAESVYLGNGNKKSVGGLISETQAMRKIESGNLRPSVQI